MRLFLIIIIYLSSVSPTGHNTTSNSNIRQCSIIISHIFHRDDSDSQAIQAPQHYQLAQSVTRSHEGTNNSGLAGALHPNRRRGGGLLQQQSCHSIPRRNQQLQMGDCRTSWRAMFSPPETVRPPTETAEYLTSSSTAREASPWIARSRHKRRRQ